MYKKGRLDLATKARTALARVWAPLLPKLEELRKQLADEVMCRPRGFDNAARAPHYVTMRWLLPMSCHRYSASVRAKTWRPTLALPYAPCTARMCTVACTGPPTPSVSSWALTVGAHATVMALQVLRERARIVKTAMADVWNPPEEEITPRGLHPVVHVGGITHRGAAARSPRGVEVGIDAARSRGAFAPSTLTLLPPASC